MATPRSGNPNPQAQTAIRERLGWLTVANLMQQRRDEITGFVNGVRQAGYRSTVLLGIGGSSLCPEVLRLTSRTPPAPRHQHPHRR
jgi:hypothetical protein